MVMPTDGRGLAGDEHPMVAEAYSLSMSVLRKRADRIRGIAGSLDGTMVLVADGTQGAGPGIARVFATAGAAVVVAGPDSPTIDVQLHRLGNTPIEVTGIVATANTDDDRNRLLDSIGRQVDTVVLNPGDYSLDETSRMGARSLVALGRMVARQMQDRGHPGNIIFVTGIESAGPDTPAVAFLTAEMKQLARSLAPNAIRVNAIAPGQIGTNRRGNPLSSRISPLGHVTVHPIEVGKAAWFLANDDLSAAMTGTTLKIDRGATLLRPEW